VETLNDDQEILELDKRDGLVRVPERVNHDQVSAIKTLVDAAVIFYDAQIAFKDAQIAFKEAQNTFKKAQIVRLRYLIESGLYQKDFLEGRRILSEIEKLTY
jgi:hypothetical protein